MKKMLITFTDEQAKELAKHPNMSEAVRNAVDIYNEHISTDTVEGLRLSYKQLQLFMEGKFESYDYSFKQLDKLINVLESRM